MARAKKSCERGVENRAHMDKERTNELLVGLVTPKTDRDTVWKTCAHAPMSPRDSLESERLNLRRSRSWSSSIRTDPFDWILVAQARVEVVTLLTVDDTVACYSTPIQAV